MPYRCQLCTGHNDVPFQANSRALILNHYSRVHCHDPNFHVTCGIQDCSTTFKSFEGLKSHIRRHHKDYDLHCLAEDVMSVAQNENHLAALASDSDNHDSSNDQMYVDNQSNANSDSETDELEELTKQNALFLLKMKETHNLTQKAIDSVVTDTDHIVKCSLENFSKAIENKLSSAGINCDDVPGLQELLSDDSHVANRPFSLLQGKYQQMSYYREHFNLVEPQCYSLGQNYVQQRTGVRLKRKANHDEMVIVPLLENIEQMLNDPTILYEVENPHNNTTGDGRIYDYCDSVAFKNHPLFGNDHSALQILMYYDDVEVVNPLGSKTKKHKQGIFYYTLGNIRPIHRSQLKAIQLAVLVKRIFITKYGMNAIMEPIMEEIAELEKDGGYEFKINGAVRSFTGTIAFVSGDNLASQEIGGFTVGPGSNKLCRECEGEKIETKTMFHESQFTLRTKDRYDNQCVEVEADPTLSSTYGVKFSSGLCQSRYFHVIGGLPGDAMHDVLEGCLQYECKELLKYLILEVKYLKLDDLNSRLKDFDFGYYNDKNKPSQISDKTLTSDSNTLHQKASQMWCLARTLPMIIGDKVPPTDDKWNLFLNILDITDAIFPPVTSPNQAAHVAILIEDHHEQFRLLYPNCSIIPKMHYLIHYPRAMIRLGPMVTHWCMRFEAKHRHFKQLATVLGNFTNLYWTLAERHQLGKCYERHNIHKCTGCGPGKQKEAGTTEYFQELSIKDPNINANADLNEHSWVTVSGTKYKIGAVIHSGFYQLLPSFSIIKKIIVVDGNLDRLYFCLASLDTIEYREHYHAFRIRQPLVDHITVCKQYEFASFLPLHITKPFGIADSYVIPKYDIDLYNLN